MDQVKNDSSVEQILTKCGPSRSARIVDSLVATGLTRDAAKKRVQRAGSSVSNLSEIRLPHNEAFLYIKNHFKMDIFWKNLLKDLLDTGSAYGTAVGALVGRGGLVPDWLFPTISGSPLLLKGHISSQRVLTSLLNLGMLEKTAVPGIGACVTLGTGMPFPTLPAAYLRALLLAEGIFLDALKDWLRKMGLVSYDTVAIRSSSDKPQFGQFAWDLVAPSYVHPFVDHGKNGVKPKPGFVVADVNLHSELDTSHVSYFVRKCNIMRGPSSTRPFMGILVANWFHEKAFASGRKKNGLVFTTPAALFGEDIEKGLQSLIHTLTNAAAAVQKNPEIVAKLFAKLSRIEGAAANLRGPLFEMIVGYCVSAVEGGFIDIRVLARHEDQQAEIDLLRVNGTQQEVWCYECRGHLASVSVSLDDVQKWLESKVPVMRRYLLAQSRFANREMGFEFWTTGKFTADALSYLKNRKSGIRKYTLGYRQGKQVAEYVQKAMGVFT